MEGAILLHRRLLDSYAFTNEVTLKIWIWLLLRASWKQSHVSLSIGKSKTTVTVERGQMIFGRNQAAKELRIPAKTIERHCIKLEENLQIVRKVTSHYTIITICKYESYQSIKNTGVPPVTHRRPTDDPPTATYNNANKENKEASSTDIYELMRRQLLPTQFSDRYIEAEAEAFVKKYKVEDIKNLAALVNKWVSNMQPDIIPKRFVN